MPKVILSVFLAFVLCPLLTAGDVKVTIKEWDVPTPNSHPYGIASTSDGMVWYSESGVRPNTVVAFNPKAKSF